MNTLTRSLLVGLLLWIPSIGSMASDTPTDLLMPVSGEPRAPSISVSGNAQAIPSGSTGFSTANYTDFGELGGQNDLVRTFTIANSGSTTLTLTSVSLEDAGGHFSISASPASSVPASGSATFDVTFSGTTAGVGFAKIIITSDDPTHPTYTFFVRGISLVCWTCGGKLATDASVCGSHGTCEGPDSCACHARWAGDTCGTFMEFEGGLTSVAAAGSVFFSVARTFKGPSLDPSQVYTWKIFVDSYSPLPGKVSAISIGISTDDTAMLGAILGESAGWSYDSVAGEKIVANVRSSFGPTFGGLDTITVVFDGPAQTLSYFLNGETVGQAINNVKRARGNDHLYPAVSMYCQHCAVTFK